MPEPTGRYRVLTPRTGKGDRFGLIGQLPKLVSVISAPGQQPVSGLPEEFVEFRRDPLMTLNRGGRGAMERRAVPLSTVYGSLEERIMYKELQKRQIPFDFQSSLISPRRVEGAMVPDFVLLDRPVIIPVDGGIWHRGLSAETRDYLQQDKFNYIGWDVYVIRAYEIANQQLTDLWFRRYIDVPRVKPFNLSLLQRLPAGRIVTLPTRLGIPLKE